MIFFINSLSNIAKNSELTQEEFYALISETQDFGTLDLGGSLVQLGHYTSSITKNITIKNGTIKRASPPTAITQNITNIGDFSFEVDDATGFRAGQQIQIIWGTSINEHVGITGSARIETVSGNIITTFSNQNAVRQGPAGSVLTTIFPMFSWQVGKNIIFDNVNYDGNKANNKYTWDWALNGIVKVGDGQQWINSTIVNTPCESLTLQQGGKINSNRFYELNGSAVHISNSADAIVQSEIIGNIGDGICLVPLAENGHNEGVISLSSRCQWIRIEDNDFKNGLEGCYGVQTLEDFDIEVSNNRWENFSSRLAGISAGHPDPIDLTQDIFINVPV